MKTLKFFLIGICLLLLAGISFAQTKQKTQEIREMTVSVLKSVRMTHLSRDSTVLIVKSTIPNLALTSTNAPSEDVKKISEDVWYMFLPAETQTIYFNAAGFKLVEREYTTFAKNRVYEVAVKPKKSSKTWVWIVGAGAVGGGVAAFLAAGGKGGGTTTPPNEKLPDPPGNP